MKDAATNIAALCSMTQLGVFSGFVSLYFLRTTLWMEDMVSRLRSPWIRWALSAVGLGLMIYFLPPLYGEGYDSLRPMLSGSAGNGALWLFVLVLVFKVFSMSLTNAGGGVGGTFGPTLFVGAVAGFVMATAVNSFLPYQIPVSNFVLVGMAGTMAGVMQAPLTAIFLIAEISGGYILLVPLILTAAVSYGVMRIFEKYSIYTKRIAASGELLTHDSDQAVLTLLKTDALLETDFTPADIRRDMFRTDLYDTAYVYNYMHSAPEYIYRDEPMESVMRKFEKTGAWNLPVVTSDRTYLGFLSKSKIFNAYRQSLRDFSQD